MPHLTRHPARFVGIAAVLTLVSGQPAAAQQPAPPAESGTASAATIWSPPVQEYRLEPGDKLRIDVYKDEQLSQSVQIRPDGKITMPLIGDVRASGLTPLALRDQLTQALQEYVNRPVITVVVVEATAPIAYVVGEVNRPGSVTVQGRMTVLQALAVVGGLKDFANTKKIHILRSNDTGAQQRIPYDYKAALKGEGPQVFLLPGDTVVVPD